MGIGMEGALGNDNEGIGNGYQLSGTEEKTRNISPIICIVTFC